MKSYDETQWVLLNIVNWGRKITENKAKKEDWNKLNRRWRYFFQIYIVHKILFSKYAIINSLNIFAYYTKRYIFH